MKAMVYERYGPPEVLQLKEVEKPQPAADQVLIKIQATSVTAADWRLRKPDPVAARLFNGLFKPKKINILGYELAGEVETVGTGATRFKPGDRVFGNAGFRFGAYAQYTCVQLKGKDNNGLLAIIPESISFNQAAVISFGGLAALNILRQANIQRGQKVLVIGASGSAGTYAVQLAKYFDAEVTGVCSAANFELVKSLGADKMIDYTKEDFTEAEDRYDVIFDAVGKLFTGVPKSHYNKALKPSGVYLSVEMDRKDRVEDLEFLAELVSSGVIQPVIDRVYPLEELAAAHRYVEKMHKKGNVVISVG